MEHMHPLKVCQFVHLAQLEPIHFQRDLSLHKIAVLVLLDMFHWIKDVYLALKASIGISLAIPVLLEGMLNRMLPQIATFALLESGVLLLE
jgi:hypothetical protein